MKPMNPVYMQTIKLPKKSHSDIFLHASPITLDSSSLSKNKSSQALLWGYKD